MRALCSACRKSTARHSGGRSRKLALIVCLVLTGCREQIVHNLSESEANRFLTRLHDIRIDAQKERQPDGKWLVSVPRDDSAASIKFLDSARMFRQTRMASEEGSGIISTREDQRLRSERVLSQGIEQTLSSISGVLEAHVHLNLPPADPLFGYRIDSSSGSASVLLVADGELTISREEIVSLVTGASGIEAKAVSVVISRGGSERRPASEETVGAARIVDEAGQQRAEGLPWSVANPFFLLGAFLLSAASLLGVLLWRMRERVEGAL